MFSRTILRSEKCAVQKMSSRLVRFIYYIYIYLSQDIVPGCFACGNCYVCKMGYLTPCDSFTSYYTTQVFSIGKRVTCQCTGLIYLAEYIKCERSCVGYSTSNIPKRFSNLKSHMKSR